MLCIFCLNEKPPSEEHVFPDVIGGALTIDRVCKECNSLLNERADRDLIQHPFVRMRRALLRIPDRRGNVLDPFADIFGKGTIVGGEPGQEVRVTLDPVTKRTTLRLLRHKTEKVGPEGEKEVQIKIDAADADQIPTIIRRERKRRGLPELSEGELDRRVSQVLARGPSIIETPVLRHQPTFDFTDPGRGLLKIAYELAWYWLGDDYLHDVSAEHLRQVILSDRPLGDPELPQIRGSMSGGEAIPPLHLWNYLPNEHLALMNRTQTHVVIGVRVFNTLSALVAISEEPGRYHHLAESGYAGNFVKLDPVSRTLAESSFAKAVRDVSRSRRREAANQGDGNAQ